MANKHKNRTVSVVDYLGRFHCRITHAAAEGQVKAGAKWIVAGKKLQLLPPHDQASKKCNSAAAVEARGLWYGTKLGRDSTEGGVFTFPEFVRWVESMNRRYGSAKR